VAEAFAALEAFLGACLLLFFFYHCLEVFLPHLRRASKSGGADRMTHWRVRRAKFFTYAPVQTDKCHFFLLKKQKNEACGISLWFARYTA